MERSGMGVLLGALAWVALASPAAAQQPIETLNEATGEHCAAVTLGENHVVEGGCLVHVVSSADVIMYAHVTGVGTVVLSTCEVEWDVHIDENGDGYAVNQVFAGQSCTRRPCDEPDGTLLPWTAHGWEDAGSAEAEFTFCIRTASSAPGTAGTACHMILSGEIGSNHEYETGGTERSCSNLPSIEFTCTLVSESGEGYDAIEGVHL